jgi:hypothetical protein
VGLLVEKTEPYAHSLAKARDRLRGRPAVTGGHTAGTTTREKSHDPGPVNGRSAREVPEDAETVTRFERVEMIARRIHVSDAASPRFVTIGCKRVATIWANHNGNLHDGR